MIDRISIDLSNYCSKQCEFCYNHSTREGNTLWQPREVIDFVLDLHRHGVDAVSFGGGEPFEYPGIFTVISALMPEMYVSVTSNGLPLENLEVFTRLCEHKPDKIHITIHHPEDENEVQRVLAMVDKISHNGIKSGVNLLVSSFNIDAAEAVYRQLNSRGIAADRIIVIPRRFSFTPATQQLARVAGEKPFQSPSCLTKCQKPDTFCSVSWDKKVHFCSFAGGKASLTELTWNGLQNALARTDFICCQKGVE